MLEIITKYVYAFWDLTLEMSPYLLLGFFIAGLLHVYFPKDRVTRYLGKNNFTSVLNASLIGIPLPLCSCGVIPTGISFYKSGASKGSSVSFLISTPQTGIDSIMATYSLLGLPLAIIRPIIALFTGLFGGLLTNMNDKEVIPNQEPKQESRHNQKSNHKNTIIEMLRYAFVEFLQDISKWLIIGLLIAALMAVIIPDNFFIEYVGNEYLSMLIVLAASIPLYVCATGSVPIAAVLLMKGLSPGAAIVFLMAGPATNAATMTVLGNVLGKKTLFYYLISIIGGAIFFGILVNEFLPRSWFLGAVTNHMGHESHLLPMWLKVASAVLLTGLVINGYWQKYRISKIVTNKKLETGKAVNLEMSMEKTVKVNGMTCNHCKANVEKNLSTIEGIGHIDVDLTSGKVKLSGDNIDLDKVRETVEDIGYDYGGEVNIKA